MSKSPVLGLAGLVFMAGSLAMLFFLILSGFKDVTPLNKTYFLQAHTEGITGALPVSQWTYFYICGDDNQNCNAAKAAYPFGSAWAANADNAPDTLIGSSGSNTSSSKMYYLWRFGWVFIMIALFFSSITFIASFLSCCGRLGASIAYYNSLMALLMHSVASAITTATFVIAQNNFKDAGRDASVGKYGFGFLWGSWAALLIATGLFGTGRRHDGGGGGGRFGRRGGLEGRRVKEEYE